MKRIRVKESVAIVAESESVYQFIFTHSRRVKRMYVDGVVRDILSACRQERDVSEVISELAQHASEDVGYAIESLQKEGVVRIREKNQQVGKQTLFIDEFSKSWTETLERERKIQESKMAVFGVGGVGSWVVNGLYQMGVGQIRIVDSDTVEESNLNRQAFREEDIGKYKVDVLREKLGSKIVPHKRFIFSGSHLDDVIEGSDFIINCADSPSVVETSCVLNQYSERYNLPLCIAGGYNLHMGFVGPIIIPGKTRTFQDFIDHQKSRDPLIVYTRLKEVEESGNLGAVAGAVANIQLIQIFKYVTGIGEIKPNRFAEINFLDLNIEWKEY